MTSLPRASGFCILMLVLVLLSPAAFPFPDVHQHAARTAPRTEAPRPTRALSGADAVRQGAAQLNSCQSSDHICSIEERLHSDPSQWLHWSEALLVCGALLMMGLYHLSVFAARRNNTAALTLALYCLLRTVNALCSGGSDWAMLLFFPNADRANLYMIGMASLALSFPFLQAYFVQLFPKQFPRLGLVGLSMGAVACLLAGLLCHFGGISLSALYLYIFLVSLYSTINLLRACLAGELGAATLLVGYLVVILAGVNDILLAKSVIRGTWLTPVGTLAFILCQSGLLARRFADALGAAERLSGQLERRNAALRAEISERSRLEQKLTQISDEERRFVSRALHDGLCQELTAARLHCSLLRSSATGEEPSPELGRLSALLESAVDQAYELSLGLWPMRPEIGDLHQALSELAEELSAEHGIEISMHTNAPVPGADSAYNGHIFQIAREALSNVIKHARARSVIVSLRAPDAPHRIELTIEDDGTGLIPGKKTPGGLGRKIMAHHAQAINASLSFMNREPEGTRVTLTVPLARQVSG